ARYQLVHPSTDRDNCIKLSSSGVSTPPALPPHQKLSFNRSSLGLQTSDQPPLSLTPPVRMESRGRHTQRNFYRQQPPINDGTLRPSSVGSSYISFQNDDELGTDKLLSPHDFADACHEGEQPLALSKHRVSWFN
ncbi:unnamed protein product, partial [Protopolystoma xenopodis]